MIPSKFYPAKCRLTLSRTSTKRNIIWGTSCCVTYDEGCNKKREVVPNIDAVVRRSHGEVYNYMNQFFKVHGCFMCFLNKCGHEREVVCYLCRWYCETYFLPLFLLCRRIRILYEHEDSTKKKHTLSLLNQHFHHYTHFRCIRHTLLYLYQKKNAHIL